MNKNEFAKTPPMGWNSYDYYDTSVTEAQVRANAEYMAKNLKQFGWEYIVVDIQWYAHKAGSKREKYQYIPFGGMEIDEYSRLLPDPERFPSSQNGNGFAPLAEYIHSLGLKFGIHIMRGIPRIAAHCHTKIKECGITADEVANASSICGWNPDMYGVLNTEAGQRYYDSLIELYASWGVDFIKCDDICNTNMYVQNPYSARHEIEMLRTAIDKNGREIVLSLSPGPALIEQAWHYGKNANMWRITDDFWDEWKSLKDMFYRCELWQDHIAQGCYPDCDMLPLGCLGKGFGHERTTCFTYEEQKTMMTLWCLFGSPLMLGAEMTKLDERTLSLLTNRRILAMLIPECRPKQICLTREPGKEYAAWAAYNSYEKKRYIALFNLNDEAAYISIAANEIKNTLLSLGMLKLPEKFQGMELWTEENETFSEEFIGKELPPHGCAVYQLLPLAP